MASDGLAGRRCVVTGASSGIGAAVCVELARGGATVLAVGRRVVALDDVVGRIRAEGGQAHALVADLTDAEGPESVAAAARALLGSVDVLVHAAGVYDRDPFAHTSLERFDAQWRVNVRAPYALTQSVLGLLGEGAVVIFVSSKAASVAVRNTAAYAASKAALEGLARVLAVELAGVGVRVNVVAPGFIATPMNAEARQDQAITDWAVQATPAGRLGRVDDIAPVVAWLASDAARFMHGSVVHIDGGYPTAAAVGR